MKTTSQIVGTFLLGCLLASESSLFAAEAGDAKWVSLFNGKDISGWVPVNDVTAQVVDGNLHVDKGMGWIRSDKEYTDFNLELEYKPLVEKYDSGIFIRCVKEGKPWPNNGWQVNLRYDRVGGLVRGYANVVPAETEKLPVNQWVKMRIELKGKKCALFVNGEKSWEFDKLDRDTGYIGIQIEDRAFDFRNIRIQELPAAAK